MRERKGQRDCSALESPPSAQPCGQITCLSLLSLAKSAFILNNRTSLNHRTVKHQDPAGNGRRNFVTEDFGEMKKKIIAAHGTHRVTQGRHPSLGYGHQTKIMV